MIKFSRAPLDDKLLTIKFKMGTLQLFIWTKARKRLELTIYLGTKQNKELVFCSEYLYLGRDDEDFEQ